MDVKRRVALAYLAESLKAQGLVTSGNLILEALLGLQELEVIVAEQGRDLAAANDLITRLEKANDTLERLVL